MVRTQVGQNCDVRCKGFNAVKLKTAEFEYEVFVLFFGNLLCETLSDVSSQRHIKSAVFQQFIGQTCGGCFSVATRDSYNGYLCIFCGKLNFRNDLHPLFAQLFNNWRLIGNSRTFHHNICGKDFGFGMAFLFPFNSIIYKNLFVLLFYFSEV